MRRSLRLAFVVLLLASAASAATGGEQIQKKTVASEGKKRVYYLYVPASASREKPAPLVVLLHGTGHDGRLLVEHWQKLAEREGVVLAGPDSRDPAGWAIPQDGPRFIYDLVEELKATQPVDPRRVYLFGHSAGAVFGLYMSALESEYFAAAAVSAGAMKESNYDMLDEAGRKVPVAIFVGTRDPLFPVSDVRRTRDAFTKRGFRAELTEIPNHDHNYYSRSAEINEKAWEFLKTQTLAAEPKYKEHQFR
ncbi:MAG TPA: dienelactone hydrolase family protein [Pyrinomonadaceae bacterium]|nr:dienelactone hydrolase family protein [Pyrinomonadaceae bacterium]